MTETAFDRPEAAEAEWAARTHVHLKNGTVYSVSQKASTVVRYGRQALAAEAEVKEAFFIQLQTETGKVYVAADQIASIEEL